MKSRRKLSFSLFSLMVFFFVFSFLSNVQAASKQDAVAQALAEAQTKSETVTVTEELYRQKLSTALTVTEKFVTHEVDSYFRYIPRRSLKDQPGKVSISKSAFEYSFGFKVFDKLPVQLGLGSGYISIYTNDDVPVSLPTRLTEIAFGAETTLPFFFDKTYLRLGIRPSFLSDNWSAKSSNLNLSSRAIWIYQPNEQLTLVLGVAVFPGFEGPIVPIGGLIYKPNEKLIFNLVPERPTISYALTDRLTVFAEGGMSGDEYKVKKDDLKGVALGYKEIHLGGGVEFKVNKYIDASVSLGGIFNHYLEYRDSLGKVNLKNGLYSEIRIEIAI